MSPRIMIARTMLLAALACGIIGLIAGFTDKQWQLGPVGWFTGGALAAILSIGVMADEYFGRHNC